MKCKVCEIAEAKSKSSYCSNCFALYMREWRAGNKHPFGARTSAAFNCRQCGQPLDKPRAPCKPCRAAYMRGRYVPHPHERTRISAEVRKEHARDGFKRWKAEHPEEYRARRYLARKRYEERFQTASGGTFNRKAIREALAEQQDGLCALCSEPLSSIMHLDHIQELSDGGSNLLSNLRVICKPCDHRKNSEYMSRFMKAYHAN